MISLLDERGAEKSAAAACRVLCSNCSGSQGQRRIVLVNGWNYYFFAIFLLAELPVHFFPLRNPPHNSSFLYFHLWHLLQTLYRNCVLHETETMWPWSVSLCLVLVCSALVQSFHAESETNLSFKVEPAQLHVHVEVGLTGMVRCLHLSGSATELRLMHSEEINSDA